MARLRSPVSFRTGLSLVFLLILITGCKGDKPWTGWYSPGDSVDNVGYKPDQPIPFDHNLHTSKMKIDCHYCHAGARRSITSGVPPTNTCMGCHKFAKTDSPHIKLLTDKYEANEPIEWTKVHDMPDFVRFTHKRHVGALEEILGKDGKKVESKEVCKTCHGDVDQMDTVEQVAPLQMGWCVDCHIQNDANISCQTCHY